MLISMRDAYGDLIRRERDRRKWLGRELAAKLDIDGGTLSRIESGRRKETPPPELLRRVEDVLGIPVAEQLAALGYRIVEEEAVTYDGDTAEILRTIHERTLRTYEKRYGTPPGYEYHRRRSG